MAASTEANAEPEMLALAADSCAEATETMLIDAEAKSWQRPSAMSQEEGKRRTALAGTDAPLATAPEVGPARGVVGRA
jgi:hypothetical protein